MRQNHTKPLAIANPVLFASPIVISECLFVQIPEEVKWFNADISSLEPTLEQAPVVFKPVGMDVAARIGDRVIDYLMLVVTIEAIIGKQFVGEKNRIGCDMLFNFPVQCGFAPIDRGNSPHFAAAFQKSHDESLIPATSPLNFPHTHFLVHVPRQATDEGFIYFDRFAIAAEFQEGFLLHCQSNPVKHEPCAFLSDPESASYFIGTDSVLAVREHPNGSKPLVQRDRRILKDSPDLHAELPMVMDRLALPLLLVFEEASISATASRAFDAVRPAQANHISESVIGISEVNDRFLECFWLNHDRPILPLAV